MSTACPVGEAQGEEDEGDGGGAGAPKGLFACELAEVGFAGWRTAVPLCAVAAAPLGEMISRSSFSEADDDARVAATPNRCASTSSGAVHREEELEEGERVGIVFAFFDTREEGEGGASVGLGWGSVVQ